MISGMCFQAVEYFSCFIPFILFTALANGLRGIGWGGLNTGGYSLLARIAPESRRGAASGLYSGVQSSAQIFFPPIALWLLYAPFGGYRARVYRHRDLFHRRRGHRLDMAPLVTRPAPAPSLEADDTVVARDFSLHRTGNFAAVDLALVAQCLVPGDHQFHHSLRQRTRHRQFGAYFIVIGATSMLGRPLLGRLSDKIGRCTFHRHRFFLQVAGLLFFAFVSDLSVSYVCGALYMLGNAIGTLNDLGARRRARRSQRRGKQMATFSVAYPLSYGLGSMLTGARSKSPATPACFSP